MRYSIAILSLLTVLCGACSCAADIVDKEWVFTAAGDPLGWAKSTCPDISTWGVDAGYLWAETSGVSPWFLGPDYIGVAAATSHYVSIKMRMRYSSGPTDRFGYTNALMYWCTTTDAGLADKYVQFKTYGNGEWKTYNIRMGGQAKWSGTIRRLRFQFCSQPNARAEIAWIKVVQDKTPPDFNIKNSLNPMDGDSIVDNTPTITLTDLYEPVSGFMRCFFYYRPGASSSDNDWVYCGADFYGADGFQYTYPQFADGTYDLGVKVVDNSLNERNWTFGTQYWLNDITINSGMPISVNVNAATDEGALPRDIFGNNLVWDQWNNKYNAETGALTTALEERVLAMELGAVRFAGSDNLEWKGTIGPVASRPAQYTGVVVKFGVDEFARYLQARGGSPEFGVKFRWAGASGVPGAEGADPYVHCLTDAIDLVEYLNSPNDGSNPNGGTDWAAVRAANGHPEPYNVKYFEIGNEPWGYDYYGSPDRYGLDGPSTYGVHYRNYLEGMTAVDPSIVVSCTAYQRASYEYERTNPDWTLAVYEQDGALIECAQMHPYFPYSAWQTDLEKLYWETMATPNYLHELISMQKSIMRLTAPEKTTQTKLRINEWNINYNWLHDPAQGRINDAHTKTLKAAIATMDALRVFVDNRNVVESASWWHLYNSSIWACFQPDASVLPVYHVFKILKQHFGDRLVNCRVLGSPTFDYTRPSGSVLKAEYGVPHITAFATKSNDGKYLYIIVINKDKWNARQANVNLSGFIQAPYAQAECEIWELNGPSVDDLDHPENVTITTSSATYSPSFTYSFPAHSVTSFKLRAAPVTVSSVGDLRNVEDETRVNMQDKVVSARITPDKLYIEETNRLSGIQIATTDMSSSRGNLASVTGTTDTNDAGERFIAAETVTHDSSNVSIIPFGMSGRTLLVGVPQTTGLLVTVWGWTNGSGAGCFYIDDKSGIMGFLGHQGIKVYSSAAPGDGHVVFVKGVKSLEIPAGGTVAEPVIRTTDASDVVTVF